MVLRCSLPDRKPEIIFPLRPATPIMSELMKTEESTFTLLHDDASCDIWFTPVSSQTETETLG